MEVISQGPESRERRRLETLPRHGGARGGGFVFADDALKRPMREQRLASTELFGSPEMLAKSLFNDFVLPFEIASVLLLVAIVGAVVLAKRERAVR